MSDRTKKLAYLLFLTTPAVPLLSWWLGQATGYINVFAWLTVIEVYGLIPVVDYLVGEDRLNPDDSSEDSMRTDLWYKLLLWSCLPVMLALIPWAAYQYLHAGFSWVGKLGWILSVGIVSSTLAINAAHELIHKRSKGERLMGGVLLSLVCYAGFKIEHVRGHHVNVATPEDASTARRGQSIYQFVPRAWLHNFVNAWRLEAQRLQYRGHSAWHWRNELIWWYALSTAIAIALDTWLGSAAVAFFLLQAAVAFTFLEVVNYLEHYGLERRRVGQGRYERTTHLHSWNSDYLLTNLLLFQLQRHS
ncbi:MAG: alkane 1-monooxygenase, partial [Gammaproteobacteria bacterium]|nr:alkane 1-monooxygenase [Gammaproteobacteria bacterium]